MDGTLDLRLAELLCARLCHDLAGPVGATSAGAELLDDLGADDAETLSLVAAAAAAAAARLRFFRAAFGPSPGAGQPAAAVRDAVDAYLRTQVSAASPGTALRWQSDAPAFDGDAARLLMNLVLLARDALPRGGTVAVDSRGGRLIVSALGEAAAPPDEVRAVLDGGEAAGPRGAQARLAVLLGRRCGLAVAMACTAGEVAFTADGSPIPSDGGRHRSDG